MPIETRSFRLEARIGPSQVLKALKIVCEHPAQRDFAPDFDFDWLKRKVVLSANSQEGLEICSARFREQLVRLGAPPDEDLVLAGKCLEGEGGRWERPFGVVLQEPLVFGEMIGQALLEMRLKGVRVYDAKDCCRVAVVSGGPIAKAIDFVGFVMGFPLPSYITIVDEGVRLVEIESPRKAAKKSAKPKKKKRR
ncbi:MAG: hypothetical protein RLY93_02375 [Sumerlaeia bacterium]